MYEDRNKMICQKNQTGQSEYEKAFEKKVIYFKGYYYENTIKSMSWCITALSYKYH